MKTILPSPLEERCSRLESLSEEIKDVINNKFPEPKTYEEWCQRLSGLYISARVNRDMLILELNYEKMMIASKRLRRGYKKLQEAKKEGVLNIFGILIQYWDYLDRKTNFNKTERESQNGKLYVNSYHEAINQINENGK